MPLLPVELPPHVVAFADQVAAAVQAGDLPAGQAWHLDICAPAPGSLVAQLLPRLCAGPVGRDCDGRC